MKALFIGRFQPLHKGHMMIIKRILEETDALSIVIGSSQHAGTPENPFSADEREEMLRRALEAEDVAGYEIFSVPDIDNDDLYPGHVASLVPPFDAVYSGNPLVQRLFREAGWDVREIELINGEEYSGTEIRRRMREGGDWERLVPPPVARYIKEIRGVERVRRLGKE